MADITIDTNKLWTAWAYIQEADMEVKALSKGIKLFETKEQAHDYYIGSVWGYIALCQNGDTTITIIE